MIVGIVRREIIKQMEKVADEANEERVEEVLRGIYHPECGDCFMG